MKQGEREVFALEGQFCGGNVGNSDLPSRDIASVDREGPGDRDPKALSSLFLVSHWD